MANLKLVRVQGTCLPYQSGTPWIDTGRKRKDRGLYVNELEKLYNTSRDYIAGLERLNLRLDQELGTTKANLAEAIAIIATLKQKLQRRAR